MSQQPLRTVAETAKLLGVSESTVWVLIRGDEPQLASVEIPSAKGAGRRSTRRIEDTEIQAFIARNRVGTPAAVAS